MKIKQIKQFLEKFNDELSVSSLNLICNEKLDFGYSIESKELKIEFKLED